MPPVSDDQFHDAANHVGTMVAYAHQTMVDRGFHAPEITHCNTEPVLALARLGLVCSEAAEAMEEVRDGRKLAEVRFEGGGKPVGFPVELADIILRVFDIAGAYEI